MSSYDSPTPDMLAAADQNIAYAHDCVRQLATYAASQPSGHDGFRAVGFACADLIAVGAALNNTDPDADALGLLVAAIIQLAEADR